MKSTRGKGKREEGIDEVVAQGIAEGVKAQRDPLLKKLDEQVDKRLVETFLQLVLVILTFRDSGLLLSELGGYG